MVKNDLPKTDGHGGAKIRGSKIKNELEDWISKLVTQQKDLQHIVPSTTKAERIEKRVARKRRLGDIKTQQLGVKKNKSLSEPKLGLLVHATSNQNHDRILKTDRKESLPLKKDHEKSKIKLKKLSDQLEQIVSHIVTNRKSWIKKYEPTVVTNLSQRRRHKPTNKSEEWLQPQQSNYGGIGLARPSLFIELDDPSWQAKLIEEFSQHIPGFYGKQRTKAMKKQLDGQMLWRQLQKQKTQSSLTLRGGKPIVKIDGKLISQMNPDEKVEAMIRAGYV